MAAALQCHVVQCIALSDADTNPYCDSYTGLWPESSQWISLVTGILHRIVTSEHESVYGPGGAESRID